PLERLGPDRLPQGADGRVVVRRIAPNGVLERWSNGVVLHRSNTPVLHYSAFPHGHNPPAVRPAVSSKPHIRFMFWIACPTIPLPRLSIAERTVTRFVRLSTARPIWHILEPRVCLVAGRLSVMWTKGASL